MATERDDCEEYPSIEEMHLLTHTAQRERERERERTATGQQPFLRPNASKS